MFKDDLSDYLRHPALAAPAAEPASPTSCSWSASTGPERRRRSASSRQRSASAANPCCSSPATRFGPPPRINWPIWAERAGADIVRRKEGADPAAVIFDGLAAAKARGVDVVFIDTAGRLQTKNNLMEELKKMRRVIAREVSGAPHETLLVLDAATGQNALSQARLFHEATQVTGIVLTKLDGTAKGGIIVAVMDQVDLPIKYVGFGETVDQLNAFDAGVRGSAF